VIWISAGASRPIQLTDQFLISSNLGLGNSLEFTENLFERLLELVLLDQRDIALPELLVIVSYDLGHRLPAYSEERLHGDFLIFTLQTSDGLELGIKLSALSLDFIGIVTGNSDDSSDTLRNGSFLGDDQVFDDIGGSNVSDNQHSP